MDNAITYSRVSSKEQLDNNSLSFQGIALRKYAQELGYSIVQEFRDEGISARGMDQRQGLLDAIEFACRELESGDFFMVFDASRLCRQTSDAEAVYSKLRSHGIVITTTKREYLHNALGRRDWLRDSVEADYDSDAKSEATVERMLARAQGGAFIARAPFGYLNAKKAGFESGPSLLIDETAAELVRRTFEKASRGESIDSIVFWLMNNPVWFSRYKIANPATHKKRVRSLLQNRVFIAKNLTKRMEREVDGDWPAIVDLEVFEQVQRRLSGVTYNRNDDDSLFPLLGLLECGVCGRSYTKTSVNKSTERSYRYYHCGNPKCKKVSISTKSALGQVEVILQGLSVPGPLQADLMRQVRRDVEETVLEISKKRAELEIAKKEAAHLRDSYVESLALGRLDKVRPSLVEELIEREESKIKAIDSELSKLEIPQSEWVEEALRVASVLLCEPLRTWQNLEPIFQTRFLSAIFPSRLQCADGKVQTHRTQTMYGVSASDMTDSVTKHPQRFKVQTPVIEFLQIAWNIRSMSFSQ